jgi:hypothetical protein
MMAIDAVISYFKDLKRQITQRNLDWITRHQIRFSKKEARYKSLLLESESINSNPKKVMFWSTTSWERGNLEFMLAYALKARGHKIVGVGCKGRFMSCSMDTVLFPRPKECEQCSKRINRFLKIFHLEDDYRWLVENPKKREECILKFSKMNLQSIKDYVCHGVALGRITARDLPQYFFKLVDFEDEVVLNKYREMMVSAEMYLEHAIGLLDSEKPDRCVVTSGKTISNASFYELCKYRNIPICTWDEAGFEFHSFVFRYNDFANEYHLQAPWEKVKGEILTAVEIDCVEKYFSKTSRGKVGRLHYYKDIVNNRDELKSRLGLDKPKLVTVLTNVTWDTSCLGRDIAFDSMFDWLKFTINECLERDDIDLLIRCHPAEGNVPDYMTSQEKVSDMLNKAFPNLPSHIRVIRGDEKYSSHELCEMSDLIAVYTTTVGLEMACRGRKVAVVGESHYRGKGFTDDIESRSQYQKLLTSDVGKGISEVQRKLAIKYAYFFMFRAQTYIPSFEMETRHEFDMDSPMELWPGQSDLWDNLCENIIDVGEFVDTNDDEVINKLKEKLGCRLI